MAKNVIGVGTNPNDGSGDPVRTAFQKTNANFDEIYSGFAFDESSNNVLVANNLLFGNSVTNASINSTFYTQTSNNALNLVGSSGYKYVQNTDSRVLSGNLEFSGTNTYFDTGFYVNTYIKANTTGLYINGIVNVVTANVGNTLTVAGNVSIGGNMTVTGNVTMAGLTTFVNSTVITTSDKFIWLANTATTNTLANGSGIVIASSANLMYSSGGSSWQSNVNITPAANNLTLGNTSSLWNTYANNVYAVSVNATSINSTSVNAASHTVGTNFVANSTAITTSGYITAANGFLSNGSYANAYTDGIVVDYVATNGRISVGTADNLTFYTGGIGVTSMAVVNTTGIFTGGIINATSHTTGSGGGSTAGGITVNSSIIVIGNSTVNVSTNSTHFYAGNSTYYGFGNSTADALVNPSGNLVLTPTSLTISNATSNMLVANLSGIYSNTNLTVGGTYGAASGSGGSYVNTTFIGVGNSTVNAYHNASLFTVTNSTSTANLTANGLIVGQSVVNTTAITTTTLLANVSGSYVNVSGQVNTGTLYVTTSANVSTYFTVNSSLANLAVNTSFTSNVSFNGVQTTVQTNTFNLGTSTKAANGYTWLPNGLKMNWGWISANSTDGNATFSSAFSTATYIVTATSNSVVATYQAAVTGSNTTVALIRTANTTSTNVYWMAIGS